MHGNHMPKAAADHCSGLFYTEEIYTERNRMAVSAANYNAFIEKEG